MRVHKKLIDRPNLRVHYNRRSRDEHMGRFGGGWQWAVGFEAGPRHRDGAQTVIFNLLVASLRIETGPDWRKRHQRPATIMGKPKI
jgi:hypothetical protein